MISPLNKALNQIPQELLCPITREGLENPMLAADGFTYERDAIKKWLKKRTGSPMLGTELEHTRLLQNKTISAYLMIFRGLKSRLIKKPIPKKPKSEKIVKKVIEQLILPPEIKKKLDEALSHYYKATKDLKECCVLMQSVYEAAPYNFEVIFNYANIMRFSSEFEKSLQLIKEIKNLRPDSLIPHYMKVRILSEMNKKDKSIELLEKTLAENRILDHSLLEIRFMSYSHLSADNKSLAENFVDAYLKVIPDDPRAISHRIYIDLLNENYEKVVEMSKKYLLENQDDVSILFHLAKAYLKVGQKDESKKTYLRIISISLDKTVKAKALYELAIIRDCNTEMTQMIEELEESYKLDPSEEADGYLAALYADKKLYIKAEEWLKECEKRTPIDSDSVYLGIKAQIQESKNQYTEAIQSYIKLAEMDSQNSEYYNTKIEEILLKQQNAENAAEENVSDSSDSNNSIPDVD